MDDANYNIVPAPWTLVGSGYIFLYWFKKDFVFNEGFLDAFLRARYLGGLGAVMAVDYKSSNVGPYGELLFIPGKFKINNKKRYSITKIYVSTNNSVYSGRENWAIPKEIADFKFLSGKDIDYIYVQKDGRDFFKAKIKKYKMYFPVSTYLLPFPIAQVKKNKVYYTNFSGYGLGKLCKIEELKIDNNYFPDLKKSKPLLAICVTPFKIKFPNAKIETINSSF